MLTNLSQSPARARYQPMMARKRDQSPFLAPAVKGLRMRNRVQVKAFADQLGHSKQEISRWENGQRPFPEILLNEYLEHIGSSKDELDQEIERLSGEAVTEKPVAVGEVITAKLYPLINYDETMAPWSIQGETVYYSPDRPPRHGDGCVCRLHNDTFLIRHYVGSDGSNVFLKQLNPQKTETFLHSDFKYIRRIVLRGD